MTGVRKEGTIPSSVVQMISVLRLPRTSALFGTRRGGSVRGGERTNRNTVFGKGRSTGMFEVAN